MLQYTTGKLSRRNLFGMSHFLLKIPPTAEPGGLKELRHDVTMYVCSFVSVVQNYSNQSYSKFCYLICLMCFTNWKHLSHEFLYRDEWGTRKLGFIEETVCSPCFFKPIFLFCFQNGYSNPSLLLNEAIKKIIPNIYFHHFVYIWCFCGWNCKISSMCGIFK